MPVRENTPEGPELARRIRYAKKAQLRRNSGSKSASRDRCKSGKPCGATCIPMHHNCLVDAPGGISEVLGKGSRAISEMSKTTRTPTAKKPPKIESPPEFKPRPSGTFLKGEAEVKFVLGEIKQGKKIIDVNGSVPAGSINWESALGKGGKVIGNGEFGAFIKVPKESLSRAISGDNPDGYGIKYGKVSTNEVKILEKVGKAGIGPTLLASRVNSAEAPFDFLGYRFRYGAVAMGIVPGTQLNKVPQTAETVRSYLSSLKELHLSGVAHNDAKGGNSMLHNGKVRFIDFGLSQDNIRAAMYEAIGGATGRATVHYARGTEGQKTLLSNLENRVKPLLESKGFNPQEIAKITWGGIRKPDSFYDEGVFKKVPNSLAKQIIQELYHGF